jgi:putative oxidoreductase
LRWWDEQGEDDEGFLEPMAAVAPYHLSILRIVAAFLFMQFGTAKWFAFPGPIVPGGGTVSLSSLLGVGAFLESVGGLLLLFGLFTRPVAFLLSGEMAFAYFMSHAPQGYWPVLNQGTPFYFHSSGFTCPQPDQVHGALTNGNDVARQGGGTLRQSLRRIGPRRRDES